MNDSVNQSSCGDAGTTVRVGLDERSYDIHIGPGLLARCGGLVGKHLDRPKTAIVTDENVAGLHLPTLQAALNAEGIEHSAIVMPPGETTKSYDHLAHLCDELLRAGIERADTIIAFGGGVIGDLAGFAAAILRRGVNFIQIPTTLLAQVDSSVGGKTGINSTLGKNLIGAFHQPVLVLADTDVLDTLPQRQFAAGYAETAKYGLLGDAAFFDWLEDNGHNVLQGHGHARQRAIEVSCRAKARIVAEDEREGGVRALLNLGHTFGHALEAATGYGERLLHGEGVAVGMVMAFRFSQGCGHCADGIADRVAAHLRLAGLPASLNEVPGPLPPARELVEIMRQDKKAKAGKLTFILVRGIGEAFVTQDVDETELIDFLEQELSQR